MSGSSERPPDGYDEALRTRYAGLARTLEALVVALLRAESIDHIVESRAKSVESVATKVARKAYADPLNEITDFAGVRVIVPSVHDVSAVGQLLRRELEVDVSRSISKAAELGADRFGYLGDHHIVRLGGSRGALPEYREYTALWAEVQVRTLFQDAWARGSHFLIYKRESEVPDHLQRRYNALAALFEIGDREFAAVLAEQREGVKRRGADVRASADLPLTAETLAAYVEESPRARHWNGIFERLGYELHPPSRLDRTIAMAARAGIQSTRQLDTMLDGAVPWGEGFLRAYGDRLGEAFGHPVRAARNGFISALLVGSFPHVFPPQVLARDFETLPVQADVLAGIAIQQQTMDG